MLGVAVLAGLLVVSAPRVGAKTPTAVVTPGQQLALSGSAPAVDLSQDDDETARDLKDRTTDTNGAAASYGRLDHVRVFFAHNPAAQLVAAGRIALSLGPRAPPHARNFDLRRLAWQA